MSKASPSSRLGKQSMSRISALTCLWIRCPCTVNNLTVVCGRPRVVGTERDKGNEHDCKCGQDGMQCCAFEFYYHAGSILTSPTPHATLHRPFQAAHSPLRGRGQQQWQSVPQSPPCEGTDRCDQVEGRHNREARCFQKKGFQVLRRQN